jgi:hypothetical protein
LTNVAFACTLQLGETSDCVDLLLATDRAPEAALFSRTFAPSQTPRAVKSWRQHLEVNKKPKQAAAIADPLDHPEEFEEGWTSALEKEEASLRGELEGPDAGGELNGLVDLSLHDATAEVEVDDVVLRTFSLSKLSQQL